MAAHVTPLHSQRFGMLIAIEPTAERRLGSVVWRCKCDCGNEKLIPADTLRRGNSNSCGCYRRKIAGDRTRKHGYDGRPEYKAWISLRSRCNNPKDPNYKNYGARGIRVCEEWQNSFVAFHNHIGDRPSPHYSVDRIDNSKGYEPGNVRWADSITQANNQRRNIMVTIDNETLPMAIWARKLNIPSYVIKYRIENNMPLSNIAATYKRRK
jgi:hypothetical protein